MKIGALLGIFGLTITTGCVNMPLPVQTARPVEYVIPVRADRPWQNSNVMIRQGQVLHCAATGRWSDDFGDYGPEGSADLTRDSFGIAAPAGALLIKISGQTNRVYYAGTHLNLTAERSGHVYFRNNAALAPNAQGALKVTMMVASDADGDGLSDYEELYIWRTNPQLRDSYGAGFSDAELVQDLRNRPDGVIKLPQE